MLSVWIHSLALVSAELSNPLKAAIVSPPCRAGLFPHPFGSLTDGSLLVHLGWLQTIVQMVNSARVSHVVPAGAVRSLNKAQS